jgi:hypothetical protein
MSLVARHQRHSIGNGSSGYPQIVTADETPIILQVTVRSTVFPTRFQGLWQNPKRTNKRFPSLPIRHGSTAGQFTNDRGGQTKGVLLSDGQKLVGGSLLLAPALAFQVDEE